MVKRTNQSQMIDGQLSFSGGMNMISSDLGQNQYRYAENIVTRSGDAETRPGMRRAFPVTAAGWKEGFWFGDEGAGTGFWFPFSFVGSAWTDVQAVTFFRFPDDPESRQLVVASQTVFVHDRGFIEEIQTAEKLGATEKPVFVQANERLVMLRGTGKSPMYWDGTDTGFVYFGTGDIDSIPEARDGAYVNGRLWLVVNDDELWASDILNIENYDRTYQRFTVQYGDGDSIMRLWPYHDDYFIVFKERSWHYLTGLSAPVKPGEINLSDNVAIKTGSTSVGLVARNAVASYGEDVAFLSYVGVTTLSRTHEGKLYGRDIPLSAMIQPVIDSINWNHVENACMVNSNNYLLCSVPRFNATDNNATLVYDLIGNNGEGAWVSVWCSEMYEPLQYFKEKDLLYFLNSDGAFKIMWSPDPWDSEDIYDDTELYDEDKTYEVGEHCLNIDVGVKTIYTCIQECKGQSVTDTDYFEPVSDITTLYQIQSEIRTRFFRYNDKVSPKRHGRLVMQYRHRNPKIEIEMESEDFSTLNDVFDSDIEYSQVAYEVDHAEDWDDTNVNLDFATPHREDYTVFLPGNIDVDFNSENFGGGNPVTSWSNNSLVSSGGNDCVAQLAPNKIIPITIGDSYKVTINYRITGTFGSEYCFGRFETIRIYSGGQTVQSHTLNLPSSSGEITLEITADGSSDESIFYFYIIDPEATEKFIDNIVITPAPKLFHATDSNGINLNAWEYHNIRMIPSLVNTDAFALRIKNKRGSLGIQALAMVAELSRFGGRDR